MPERQSTHPDNREPVTGAANPSDDAPKDPETMNAIKRGAAN